MTLSPLKRVSTVTKLSRLSGYSRQQIYRLLKAGQFSLGSTAALSWAKKVRKRSGFGRFDGWDFMRAAKPSSYPRTQKVRLRRNARRVRALISSNRDYIEQNETRLKHHIAKKSGEVLFAAALLAEINGEPLSRQLFDKHGEATFATPNALQAKAAFENGKWGQRQSRKRKSFIEVQRAINGMEGLNLVAGISAKRGGYATTGERLGVSGSTLWRWLNEGHLKPFKHLVQWSGFGSSAQNMVTENRGKKVKTETFNIDPQQLGRL